MRRMKIQQMSDYLEGLNRRIDGLASNQMSIRENISRLEKVAGCGHPREDRRFEPRRTTVYGEEATYYGNVSAWIERCGHCGATIRQMRSGRELIEAEKAWHQEMADSIFPEGAEE